MPAVPARSLALTSLEYKTLHLLVLSFETESALWLFLSSARAWSQHVALFIHVHHLISVLSLFSFKITFILSFNLSLKCSWFITFWVTSSRPLGSNESLFNQKPNVLFSSCCVSTKHHQRVCLCVLRCVFDVLCDLMDCECDDWPVASPDGWCDIFSQMHTQIQFTMTLRWQISFWTQPLCY